MAYDDQTFRRRDTDRPDRVGLDAYQNGGYAADDYARPDYHDGDYPDRPRPDYSLPGYPEPEHLDGARRAAPAARLGDVFDDPAHGDPGRDRMAVHLGWELVLLLGAGALAYLLYRADPDIVRRPALDPLLVFGAAFGLLVLGAGLTLRAGAPNLALGPVAVASALHFAENVDRGMLPAVGGAAVAATVGGLVLALLVVGFHVPSWAASLAGALAVVVFIQLRPAPVAVQGGFDPTRHGLYLFGGFTALALLGGVLGTVKAVRRAVGRFRPVGDPALRRGALAGTLTSLAIVFSLLMAAAAGVLFAAAGGEPVEPTTGFEWTGLALGTAMLAGTSAFGRRGGIFGTVFAVALIVMFLKYSEGEDWRLSPFAAAAGVLAAGLVVTRLVETYGRPLAERADGDDDWRSEPAPHLVGRPPVDRPEHWSSTLPALPADGGAGAWDDERWGPPPR